MPGRARIAPERGSTRIRRPFCAIAQTAPPLSATSCGAMRSGGPARGSVAFSTTPPDAGSRRSSAEGDAGPCSCVLVTLHAPSASAAMSTGTVPVRTILVSPVRRSTREIVPSSASTVQAAPAPIDTTVGVAPTAWRPTLRPVAGSSATTTSPAITGRVRRRQVAAVGDDDRGGRRDGHRGGCEEHAGAAARPAAPRRRRQRRRRSERRVLLEDRLLEPPQRRAGLDAQLADEALARLPVRRERLGLPAPA